MPLQEKTLQTAANCRKFAQIRPNRPDRFRAGPRSGGQPHTCPARRAGAIRPSRRALGGKHPVARLLDSGLQHHPETFIAFSLVSGGTTNAPGVTITLSHARDTLPWDRAAQNLNGGSEPGWRLGFELAPPNRDTWIATFSSRRGIEEEHGAPRASS